MSSRNAKILLVATIVVLVIAFFLFDLQRFLTLDYLKTRQQAFVDFYHANRLLTVAIYFVLYVIVTALSLPGAAVMTLAGGALLGFWVALITVSFASTIGATLAFLVSRFLLRDWVQNRFGDKLKAINDGFEREGSFVITSYSIHYTKLYEKKKGYPETEFPRLSLSARVGCRR